MCNSFHLYGEVVSVVQMNEPGSPDWRNHAENQGLFSGSQLLLVLSQMHRTLVFKHPCVRCKDE